MPIANILLAALWATGLILMAVAMRLPSEGKKTILWWGAATLTLVSLWASSEQVSSIANLDNQEFMRRIVNLMVVATVLYGVVGGLIAATRSKSTD